MDKLFKFHGRFKDLIPAGWEFQKLYAHNYRQYSICPAGLWADTIRVWQHLGGYVEVNDYFDHSEVIVKHLVNGGPQHPTFGIVLNRKTGEVLPYDRVMHSSLFLMLELEKQGASEQEIRAGMSEHALTWRACNLEDATIAYLKQMFEWGWLK